MAGKALDTTDEAFKAKMTELGYLVPEGKQHRAISAKSSENTMPIATTTSRVGVQGEEDPAISRDFVVGYDVSVSSPIVSWERLLSSVAALNQTPLFAGSVAHFLASATLGREVGERKSGDSAGGTGRWCDSCPIAGEKEKAARTRFEKLVSEWKEDTCIVSDATELVMHSAYQQIIGLGPVAVPWLLKEMNERPHHWHWALMAITGNDPVPIEARGNLEAIAKAWLSWARDEGYSW